jgi:Protein of unknown function (DUF1360)
VYRSRRFGRGWWGNSLAMALTGTIKRVQARYAGAQRRPLGGYVVALAAYAGLVSVATLVGRVRGVRLPERVSVGDLFLVSCATHKASRLLTKSAVTSALRAPFVRYEEPAGPAEVNESVPEEHGVRHAVGELVTCPFCAGVWIATSLSAGLVFAPRATRLTAAMLTAVAASDWLHLGYARAKGQ